MNVASPDLFSSFLASRPATNIINDLDLCRLAVLLLSDDFFFRSRLSPPFFGILSHEAQSDVGGERRFTAEHRHLPYERRYIFFNLWLVFIWREEGEVHEATGYPTTTSCSRAQSDDVVTHFRSASKRALIQFTTLPVEVGFHFRLLSPQHKQLRFK
jgi:hypothetical protein